MDKASHTNSGDIDSKRLPSFLLGVVLALSILYVALEYTSISQPYPTDDSLDEMVQDIDMQTPATQPDKPVTTQVKAVDKEVDSQTDEATDNSAEGPTLVTGGDEALTDKAHVSEAIPQTPADDKPIHFRVVEQIPQFEGGMEAFTKWLTQNLCYPAEAQRGGIQGKVVVSFIINRDGSISSPKIEQSVHPLLDREAMRVVKIMPRWKPGKENDKPCRTLFAIPIVFQL